ncbi:pentatricopeptide repeat-containing protein [Senna tora]|uniref:Pentatricopeptide repeat-containing protein n=1 Tax=Senna tora TaxID=362788 RepID=A0A834XAH3_9FABA|nr:pentatricopeptide repeat-containing protein [Senna tora]
MFFIHYSLGYDVSEVRTPSSCTCKCNVNVIETEEEYIITVLVSNASSKISSQFHQILRNFHIFFLQLENPTPPKSARFPNLLHPLATTQLGLPPSKSQSLLQPNPIPFPPNTPQNRIPPPNLSVFLQLGQIQSWVSSRPQIPLSYHSTRDWFSSLSTRETPLGFSDSGTPCFFSCGEFDQSMRRLMRLHGCTPTVRSCNELLDALQRENKIQLAWCLYGALVRFGYRLGRSTLSIVAQILSKNGKFDKIVRLLDSGIHELGIYNLVIGGYSEKGDFKSAFDALNEMSDRKLSPDFVTYSSILDGACKHGDNEVIERIINIMVEKKLLPECFSISSSNYDLVLQKLSEMGKTYAAEMFFRRACEENINLQDVTYGCLLRALSKGRRIREAVYVYSIVSQRGIALDDSNYQAFVDFLCEENLYVEEKSCELLKDIIRRGFDPSASELSKFMASLCNEGRWKEAEDLLDALVERGLVPDSGFCSLLMKHYCKCRQIGSAIELHDKMEKVNGKMEITAYNVFLNRLFVVRKIEEAMKVFEYMRRQDLLSSESFRIMICELCKVKELRKAMKLHDEMLKMGLKPDKPTYRRLIAGFV